MHRLHAVAPRVLLGAIILVAFVPAVAFGIARGEILARGKVWVDKKVPYSQSRYAKVSGALISKSTPLSTAMTKGYRTDCSGFVSMCLGLTTSGGLPRSLTTATFKSVLTEIPAAELLPGDVVLRPSTGYPYGHAVIFVRWANSSHKSYWSYEESGSKKGTVTRLVSPYPFFGAKGFSAYRYVKTDDYYSDCQEEVRGDSRYHTAVVAARMSYPETSTPSVEGLVVASGKAWIGNLAGTALAGAAGGPLLLTKKGSLPATAAAAIKRLKPTTVYVIGGPSIVASPVVDKIASLGTTVVRMRGRDRYVLVARAAHAAVTMARDAGRTVTVAYLVSTSSFGDGVAVSPIAAKTARPVLLTRRRSVPSATLDELKADGIRKVFVVGNKGVIDTSVIRTLKKRGFRVVRIAGTNRYATARAVARHGTGPGIRLAWSGLGVASGTGSDGVLACGVAQGQAGSLLLLTPSRYLHSATAAEMAEHRAAIGKVRVFGAYAAVSSEARTSIAKIMRAK